jgi:RNA ligase (TIGR02306 family)
MSSLIVEVCEIKEILTHKDADNLEISVVKGWNCIVKKGQYKQGDSVVFIPPDAILPEALIEKLGVRNYLAGQNKNRVKCAKLRGEMSYGLIIDNWANWKIGSDLTSELGIVKYEPPLRTTAGDAAPSDPFFPIFTDIENINNFPDVFEIGEQVVITEKIDGTSGRWSAFRNEDGSIEYKAGSHKLKRTRPSDEEIKSNTYWFPMTQDPVKNMLEYLSVNFTGIRSATLYGEIFGRVRGGLKSMSYGKPNTLEYAAFGLQIDGEYVSWSELEFICKQFEIPLVPVVSKIPFNIEEVRKLATGYSLMAKNNGVEQIREGVVVVAANERKVPRCSRAILKVLNPDYLILKSKKEEKGEEVDFNDV